MTALADIEADIENEPAAAVVDGVVDLEALYAETGIGGILDEIERDLVGLVPVKTRIREIAALLLVERARRQVGLAAEPPSLHMCFTGNPGTGKTTVARRMADILHGLGYIRRNHVVSVTRDDLVGQYIGHTAPKTKDVLKKAMGGVLFIDEAYYLYRPENERDYGQEAIEILLQIMETRRVDTFFRSNPGMGSRVAHHVDFPDYSSEELFRIAGKMMATMQYRLDEPAGTALRDYIERRMGQPRFANARSIRNALDRARLRQANRLFTARGGALDAAALQLITAEDIRQSRVFAA
jgi:probable Rubsico expression protein CbbX